MRTRTRMTHMYSCARVCAHTGTHTHTHGGRAVVEGLARLSVWQKDSENETKERNWRARELEGVSPEPFHFLANHKKVGLQAIFVPLGWQRPLPVVILRDAGYIG